MGQDPSFIAEISGHGVGAIILFLVGKARSSAQPWCYEGSSGGNSENCYLSPGQSQVSLNNYPHFCSQKRNQIQKRKILFRCYHGKQTGAACAKEQGGDDASLATPAGLARAMPGPNEFSGGHSCPEFLPCSTQVKMGQSYPVSPQPHPLSTFEHLM